MPLALAIAFAATGAAPAAVTVHNVKVKVKVKVKVVRGCTLHVPTAWLTAGPAGLPIVAVGSFLSDCTDEDIPARLTIIRDPADNRTDVATIDF